MMKGPALHAMLAAVLLALLATCGAARASNSRGHGDYERAHTVRVPLCISKMRDCRCSDNPNCNIQTFINELSCCEGGSEYANAIGSLGFGAAKVAECSFQETLITDTPNTEAIYVTKGVEFGGTASFSCDFLPGVEDCAGPLCEGMTITGWLKLYYFWQGDFQPNLDGLFFRGPIPNPIVRTEIDQCSPYLKRVGQRGPDGASNNAPSKASTAAATTAAMPAYLRHGYDRNDEGPIYRANLRSFASVAVGTFYVTSTDHATKHREGRIKITAAYNYAAAIGLPAEDLVNATAVDPADIPTDAFVVDPFKVDLELVGSDGEY